MPARTWNSTGILDDQSVPSAFDIGQENRTTSSVLGATRCCQGEITRACPNAVQQTLQPLIKALAEYDLAVDFL